MSEKTTTKTAGTALPEVGYYTDQNGYAWQLTAEQATKLGYAGPDPQQGGDAPQQPAGPPLEEPATTT